MKFLGTLGPVDRNFGHVRPSMFADSAAPANPYYLVVLRTLPVIFDSRLFERDLVCLEISNLAKEFAAYTEYLFQMHI